MPLLSGSITIDYTYDALGRLTAADYSDGRSFNYIYDAAGNVLQFTQITAGHSSATTYTYLIQPTVDFGCTISTPRGSRSLTRSPRHAT